MNYTSKIFVKLFCLELEYPSVQRILFFAMNFLCMLKELSV